jgi:hypothetical protein
MHKKCVLIAGKEYIKTKTKYNQMFIIIEIIEESLG